MRLCLLLVALALAVPGQAVADEALWQRLRGGGQVILMRHAVTTPGVGDPAGFKLDDCATQRNLTDAGRKDARRVGATLRTRGIPIGRVLSSPWCRCVATAQLAFGVAEPWTPLGNLFDNRAGEAEQLRALRELAGRTPTGGNVVLVTHGSVVFRSPESNRRRRAGRAHAGGLQPLSNGRASHALTDGQAAVLQVKVLHSAPRIGRMPAAPPFR